LTTNISKAIERRALDAHEAWILGTKGKDLPNPRDVPPTRTRAQKTADYRARVAAGAPVRGYTVSVATLERDAKRAKPTSARRVEIRREVYLACERGDTAEAQRLAAQLPQSYRDQIRYTAVRRGWRWP
jgi:hypothetical protein